MLSGVECPLQNAARICSQQDMWIRYGQKKVKGPDATTILRYYAKCEIPGCPARRLKERYLDENGLPLWHYTYRYEHNHFALPDADDAIEPRVSPVAGRPLLGHSHVPPGGSQMPPFTTKEFVPNEFSAFLHEFFQSELMDPEDHPEEAVQEAAANIDHIANELGALVLIAADDDAVPRVTASIVQKKLNASTKSLILGDKYDDAKALPDTVRALAAEVGEERIVCLLDQNMHYEQGDLLGTEMIKDLRKSGFQGLICVRSGSDNAKDEELYLNAGADGLLSKALKIDAVVQEIIRLGKIRPYRSQLSRCHSAGVGHCKPQPMAS